MTAKISMLDKIALYQDKVDNSVWLEHPRSFMLYQVARTGLGRRRSKTGASLRKIPLTDRGANVIGKVVYVARTAYILAENDNGQDSLLCVKVARNVGAAIGPRKWWETAQTKVTRGQASLIIKGAHDALAIISKHWDVVPSKSTEINRSHSRATGGTGGRKNGKPWIGLYPHSVTVKTYIDRGWSDYKTCNYLWRGTIWNGATDPYRIGQALAMHEAAHVIQYCDPGFAGRSRGHDRIYHGILRGIIGNVGDEIAATNRP